LEESIQALVQLFEATARFEQAAEWRTKLTVVQAAGSKDKPAWPRFSDNDRVTAER
jgi:hypothetical protein